MTQFLTVPAARAAGRRLLVAFLAALALGGLAPPTVHAQAAPSATLGGDRYLPAPTPDTGTELFALDLSSGVARIVAELVDGPEGGAPDLLTGFDGRVYFRAETPATGAELFVYDPATDEARLAADFVPGPTGSDPTALAVRDGILYVTGRTPEGGPETWAVSPNAALATDDGRLATALGAIAPNPASGRATAGWTLADAGPVHLAVVDLLGREVAVVARGPFAAGAHTAEVPAGLAPGVYVVRLQAGAVTEAARLTVVR